MAAVVVTVKGCDASAARGRSSSTSRRISVLISTVWCGRSAGWWQGKALRSPMHLPRAGRAAGPVRFSSSVCQLVVRRAWARCDVRLNHRIQFLISLQRRRRPPRCTGLGWAGHVLRSPGAGGRTGCRPRPWFWRTTHRDDEYYLQRLILIWWRRSDFRCPAPLRRLATLPVAPGNSIGKANVRPVRDVIEISRLIITKRHCRRTFHRIMNREFTQGGPKL